MAARMHPVLHDFGFFQLGTFGPLVAVGLLVGLIMQRRHGAAVGIDPDRIQDCAVYGLIAGFLGARLLYVLLDLPTFAANPREVLARGGFVWYGGILAATPTAWWIARRARIPALRALDCIAPGTMLGLAFGRLGCTMAGCDHGRAVASGAHWWTLTFTDPRSLVQADLLGKPLYPTQPMMVLSALTVMTVLLLFRRRLAPWPGALATLMFVVYAPLRCVVEYFRGDDIRGFLVPEILSTSQAIGLAVLPVGILLLLRLTRRPPEPVPAPFAGPVAGAPAALRADRGRPPRAGT
jgi:phosphatidylglycerol:prolipoprotein diacylglycerol transferase